MYCTERGERPEARLASRRRVSSPRPLPSVLTGTMWNELLLVAGQCGVLAWALTMASHSSRTVASVGRMNDGLASGDAALRLEGLG